MKPVIYAMIPARIGSTRLKMKNLALINGKPMIYYAIRAAKESGVYDKIILNSDSEIFSKIAERYFVDFYLRPEELGSSQTKSDAVVADFMYAHPEADFVAWVNPTSPFQTAEEISRTISYFIDNQLDSLITVEDRQVHCIYNGKPVNFKPDEPFAQTQNLTSVQPFIYSVMMWRSKQFLKEFDEKEFALFCGKFGTFPVEKMTAIIIKTQEDLLIANELMKVMEDSDGDCIEYDILAGNVFQDSC